MHAGAEGTRADHVTGQEEFYGERTAATPRPSPTPPSTTAPTWSSPADRTCCVDGVYKGHLIDYSLGDFGGYQNFATGGTLSLSGILTVTVTGNGVFTSRPFTSLLLRASGSRRRLVREAAHSSTSSPRGLRGGGREHPPDGPLALPHGRLTGVAQQPPGGPRPRARGRLVHRPDVGAPGVGPRCTTYHGPRHEMSDATAKDCPPPPPGRRGGPRAGASTRSGSRNIPAGCRRRPPLKACDRRASLAEDASGPSAWWYAGMSSR